MKLRLYSVLLAALLLVCLSVSALAAAPGSIRPWLLDIDDAKWGPVPQERLETDLFYTNGNIVSKYYKNSGVLYHSYISNPAKDVISNKTRANVIIYPPKGAAYWLECYDEGISLTQEQQKIRIFNKDRTLVDMRAALESPDHKWLRSFDKGIPYYEQTMPLFDHKKSSSMSTPIRLASEDMGNLYLVGWYNASKELIRVDWLVETSDDFSIPQDNIMPIEYDSYPSEDALPDKITRPSLVNPQTPYNEVFRLVMYYYPSYRGNMDFAELHMIDSMDNIVSKFLDGPVVIYWPYPEGYSASSPVHYQLKHYMDNTRTDFEMLDVTPTQKGLRIVTESFSPYELTWTEVDTQSLPSTGDSGCLALWLAAGVMSCTALAFLLGKKRRTN